MEKRYESDLTKKEKRQLEKEKIKSLKGLKKIEYLIMYYWYWAVMAAAIVGTGVLLHTMYVNKMTENILSVAIIDANTLRTEGFEPLYEELTEYFGVDDSKYEDILLDTSAVTTDAYNGAMKTMILMSADTGGDIVICDQNVYDEYKGEGIFLDWKEILGEDYGKYESYMTDGMIDLSKVSEWQNQEYTIYTPAYCCVLDYTEKLDNVVKFLEYFCE